MSQQSLEILSQDWGWNNVRYHVFQFIAWGYQKMEEEIRQLHEEEDITGLIRKGIDEKLEEEWPKFIIFSAHNEDPVDDAGKLGKKRPLVDIMIQCRGSQPRKRYRIEAKRCAKKSYPIGKYAVGIRAFLQGRYAIDSPEAGMLGLVQSDSPQYWKAELSGKLRKDTSLRCESVLTDADITPDLPGTSCSHHRRNNGEIIVLYHAFLDCTLK